MSVYADESPVAFSQVHARMDASNPAGGAEMIPPTATHRPLTAVGTTHNAASANADACVARPAATRAAPVKNGSRERLKAELTFLRGKVVELEQEARELQARRDREKEDAARAAGQISAWMAVSQHQHERRQCAEQENAHLKYVLEHQLRVAKSLESLLHKRLRGDDDAEAVLEGSATPMPSPPKRMRVNETVGLLFSQLERELDERVHPMVDEVFQGIETSVAPTLSMGEWTRDPTVKMQLTQTGREQVVVESWKQKWVPFEFESACNAVWRAVELQLKKPNHIAESSIFSPHLIALKDRMKTVYGDQERVVSGVVVLKRYQERDRMVMVWRTLSTCSSSDPASNDANPHRAEADETGWSIVQRVTEPPSATVTVCARCLPLNSSLDEDRDGILLTRNDAKTGDFTKVVLDLYANDLAGITETMENLLLEDSLAL